MAQTRTRPLPWTTLAAVSTVAVFVPSGAWESAAGVTGARASGEMRGKNGNAQAQPAVQVANDQRSPGAATGIGSTMTNDGVTDPVNPSTSLSTDGVKYLRTGWLVSLISGSNLATASVAGVIELLY